MKTYKSNEEVRKDIVNEMLIINDDVHFDFDSLIIGASIKAWDIKAQNINAWDIKAQNINAWNIEAGNIKAWNIKAGDINAWDISFYASCIAYNNIECESINGYRNNSFYKCLDGKLTIKKPKDEINITVKINGKECNLSDISEETLINIRNLNK